MDVVIPAIHRLIGNGQEFWEPFACDANESLSPVTNFLLQTAFSYATKSA